MYRSLIRRAAAAVAVLPLVSSLTACLAWEEHLCNEGEYPAWVPGDVGATCFADGEEPTAGYARYPEGDVPDLLDDDYVPPERYPELKPWVKDYLAWQEDGAKGNPPAMPPVG